MSIKKLTILTVLLLMLCMANSVYAFEPTANQTYHAQKALSWLKQQQDSRFKNAVSFNAYYSYYSEGEVSGKVDLLKWQSLDFDWEPDPYFTLDGSYTKDPTTGTYLGPIHGTWGGTTQPGRYTVKVFSKTDIYYLQASVPLNADGTWSTGDESISGELKVYLFDNDNNIVAYPNAQPTWSSANYEIALYCRTDIPYLKSKIPLRSNGTFKSNPPPRFNDYGDITRFSATVKTGDKIARLVTKTGEKIIDSTEVPRYKLLRSKYIPSDDPLSGMYGLDDRSWIYSDAMGVIVFTMAGERTRAYQILDALESLQNPDGSLYFSYDIYGGPVDGVTTTYTGSLAWLGYSAVFYEQKYKEGNYIEFAKKIADYILTLQVTEPYIDHHGHPYFGGIKGGYNDNNDPSTLKNWMSTEHNIDSYFFLRDLGELTGIQKYKNAASLVKYALTNYHWYDEQKRFKGGTSNYDLTLDSNSWGGIFAQAIGRNDMILGAANFVKGFEVANQTMPLSSNPESYNMSYTTNTLLTGFKPYLHGGQYQYPADEVWTEGTWGVINEMLRRGENADIYIDTMLAMQDADPRGGVVSSNIGSGEFHVWPEDAATAWEYITLTDYDAIWTPDKSLTEYNSDNISGKGAVEPISKLDPEQTLDDTYWADPIDTATGAHAIEKSLLVVNGAQPLNFKVSYNSLLLKEGLLGKGWAHDYETWLEVLVNGDIKIHWNANRANNFINSGPNEFTSIDKATGYDRLIKNADGSYTLTRKDQSVYQFNSQGKLIQLHNGHGQSLTMSYDSSIRLSKVTEPVSGRSIYFYYNLTGLVSRITDDMNREIMFEYDNNHNLTKVIDANGKPTSYVYKADGQVLAATDAEGVQLFSNTYDNDGRVVVQDDAITGGGQTRFTYDESSEPGKIITTITDRNGNLRVNIHDNNYQLISIKDELGNIITHAYDSFGNRISTTDPHNKTTAFSYDSQGNIITVKDPMGNTTNMTYDETNNLLSKTNAAGKQTRYTYDSNNNIVSITDPLSNTITFSYNNNGLLFTETSPRDGTTRYEYENGQVHRIIDPKGNTKNLAYDSVGRLIAETDAAGKTIIRAYDSADNLLSVTDPLGNKVSFTYNSHGDKLSETDANGNVKTFSYNGNGKLTSVVDAVYKETRYEYDGEDRRTKEIDSKGNTTTFIYDAKGRLIATTDALGNTIRIKYDALDRVIEKIDALGDITRFTYDDVGNLLTVQDPLGRITRKEYDNLYRLIRETDPMGRISQFYYDDLNRLISSNDPLHNMSSQGYDADGNQIKLTDPNNNQTIFSYDPTQKLTREALPTGDQLNYEYNNRGLLSKSTNARGQIANYQYDDVGRLMQLVDPDGTISYTYDGNGNVLTKTSSNGTISRQYDCLNRITSYTDAKGNTVRYQYDAMSNLTAITYPDGKQVQYQYNAANQLIKVIDWNNRITTYEYDSNGKLTKTIRPNGSVLTENYDSAGQLTRQKDVDSLGNIISQYDYTYQTDGNVKTETSTVANIYRNRLMEYDSVGRLIQQKSTDMNSNIISQFDFTYDNAGNINYVSIEPSHKQTVTSFTYDNRLNAFNGNSTLYDADGNMTYGPLNGQMVNFEYNSKNLLTRAGETYYTYDVENRLISVTDDVYKTEYVINPNTKLSQVLMETDEQGRHTYYVYGLGLIGQETSDGEYKTYHFDRRGSTSVLTDVYGTVTDTVEYSPYGTILERTGETETPFLYNGRYGVMSGNGLINMRTRFYNPELRRFLNRDVVKGDVKEGQSLNRYAYANGNPISYLDPFGLSRDGDMFIRYTLSDAKKTAFQRTINDTDVQIIVAKHGLGPVVDEAYKQAKDEYIEYVEKEVAKKVAKEAAEKTVNKLIPVWGAVDTARTLLDGYEIYKDYRDTIYPTYQEYLTEEKEKVNWTPEDPYKCLH